MRLFFLRHGLAGDRANWQGNDAQRPLTEKGKSRMEQEADLLEHLGLHIDVCLTSPLVRAYQTAEIVARHLSLQDKLVKDDRLAPGFDRDKLVAIVREHGHAREILLVGHEPDFSETISHVTGGGRIQVKKGGLARVDLPDAASLEGELVWLLPPSVLVK